MKFVLPLAVPLRAVQERYTLAAGAGRVGRERRLSHTVRDAVLNGPGNSLSVVGARVNIREAVHRTDPFLSLQ